MWKKGINIKSKISGLTKENVSASRRWNWTGLVEKRKHQDKHITTYWLIGGYSLRDRCKIDQMEGYPYSQRQAVCQYPSLEAENCSKGRWHSPAAQRLVNKRDFTRWRIVVLFNSCQTKVWSVSFVKAESRPLCFWQQRN